MRQDLHELVEVEVKRLTQENHNIRTLLREVYLRAYRVGYDDGQHPFKDDADPSKGRWDSLPRYYGRLRDDMRQRANVTMEAPWPLKPGEKVSLNQFTVTWSLNDEGMFVPHYSFKKEKPMALRMKKSKFLEFVEDFLRGDDSTRRELALCAVLKISPALRGYRAEILKAAAEAWDRRCEVPVMFEIGAHVMKLPIRGDEFYGSSVDMNEDEFLAEAPEAPHAKTLEPLTLDKVADRTIEAYEKHRAACKAALMELNATTVTLFEDAKEQKLNEKIVRAVVDAAKEQVMGQLLDDYIFSSMPKRAPDAVPPKR